MPAEKQISVTVSIKGLEITSSAREPEATRAARHVTQAPCAYKSAQRAD